MNDPSTDPDSSDALQQAYQRLRAMAQKLMSDERSGHTLSATDVVHEAMAKLLAGGWSPTTGGSDPQHVQFVRHAVHAMTEVLIDYARRRNRVKRGSGARRVAALDLDDLESAVEREEFDWAGLDSALRELEQIDSRRHTVVILRFFGGLNNRQIASQLGVDERTVGRDWLAARLWLKEHLSESP